MWVFARMDTIPSWFFKSFSNGSQEIVKDLCCRCGYYGPVALSVLHAKVSHLLLLSLFMLNSSPNCDPSIGWLEGTGISADDCLIFMRFSLVEAVSVCSRISVNLWLGVKYTLVCACWFECFHRSIVWLWRFRMVFMLFAHLFQAVIIMKYRRRDRSERWLYFFMGHTLFSCSRLPPGCSLLTASIWQDWSRWMVVY